MCQTHLLYVILCARRIELISGDIQVSSEDDTLAKLVEVANTIVKRREECKTVVIACTAAVGWTVDTEDDEGWKLEYDTAPFGV